MHDLRLEGSSLCGPSASRGPSPVDACVVGDVSVRRTATKTRLQEIHGDDRRAAPRLQGRHPGTSFTRTENWVIPLKDGRRVTGPISLFDGVAYFATHTPPPGGNAACAYGYGSVWGVDYRKTYQEDPAHDPPLPPYAANPYPQARYERAPGPGCTADPSNPSRGRTYTKDQPPGTTVFGVAITQTPTCADVVSYSDSFFGPYSAFANVNRGKLQLVYQTGKGGEESEGAKTKTVAETIPPPLKGVRIDSWASIVE